ncbi:MAG: Glu/Leu/Phe/Val dehydrogenase dimerization domain-containing protein [Vicinamibacterales bacterium]
MTTAPRTIVIASASGAGELGLVCVDSTVNGRARGGLRLVPDLTRRELELSARVMTLKYGFLGLPQGGAKAGVIGDPEAASEERAGRLRRFAEAAAPLFRLRAFVPDSDMGTTGADIQAMLEGVGIRVARREYRGNRSGIYTAATVFASARAASGVADLPMAGCRVAIEGFGRVGQPLAGMFVRAGARVVAISTRRGGLVNPRGLDVEAVAARIRAGGDVAVAAAGLGDPIEADALKFVPADVLCPCARHESITLADADALEARVISCGANSPITPEAERRLWERGVLCVPDFVANAGGVLGGTMEFAGWRTGEILDFCDHRFRPRVATLFEEARQSGTSVRDVAEAFALRRFDNVKRLAEQDSSRRHGVEAALAAFREGWLPGRLVRRLSVGYFNARVG